MDVVLFGLEMTIDPIAFTINIGSFHWDVYWYGITIALGFALAVFYGIKNAKRFNINVDRMLDVALVTTPVAILCARSYYLLFDDISGNFTFKEFFGFGGSGFSGLAIYGGVIGAFVCGALMCRLRKIKILDMFDLAAIGFLIGQGIGRWGNFFNQEAFGGLSYSTWWGMQSANTEKVVGPGLVHPCFLYESLWCILGFVIIHILSKKRKFSGQVVLMYGVWYGLGRTAIEGLRTDSLYLVGNIRVSQALSALLCISCAAILIYMLAKIHKTASLQTAPICEDEGEEQQAAEETGEEVTEETKEVSETEEEKVDKDE